MNSGKIEVRCFHLEETRTGLVSVKVLVLLSSKLCVAYIHNILSLANCILPIKSEIFFFENTFPKDCKGLAGNLSPSKIILTA